LIPQVGQYYAEIAKFSTGVFSALTISLLIEALKTYLTEYVLGPLESVRGWVRPREWVALGAAKGVSFLERARGVF
jgi:hypothetical protein